MVSDAVSTSRARAALNERRSWRTSQRLLVLLACAAAIGSRSGVVLAGSSGSDVYFRMTDDYSGTLPAELWAYAADRNDQTRPTGTIAVHESSKSWGSFNAYHDPSGSLQSATLGPFPSGTHTLVADYGGDDSFAPSSMSITIHVSARATLTTLSAVSGSRRFDCQGGGACPPNTHAPAGTEIVFGATSVDNSGANGTGPDSESTMTFLDNGTKAATIPTSNRKADWKVALPPGPHRITARFDGDAGYAASDNSNVIDLTIEPATTTTTDRSASGAASVKAGAKTTTSTTGKSHNATATTTGDGAVGSDSGAEVDTKSVSKVDRNAHLTTHPSSKGTSAGPLVIGGVATGAAGLVVLRVLARRRSGL